MSGCTVCERGALFALTNGYYAPVPCDCVTCPRGRSMLAGWTDADPPNFPDCQDGPTDAGPCRCYRAALATRLLREARIPARYARLRLDGFPTEAGSLEAWGAAAAVVEGEAAWLWGAGRVGKSGLLAGAIVLGCRAFRRFRYASWYEAVGALRLDNYDIDELAWERWINYPGHLVIDDFASYEGRLPDRRLIELVRRRTDRLLPLSVSGRLTPAEVTARLGDDLVCRLPAPTENAGPPLG